MSRGGMTALTAGEGLALLDAALGRDEALLVPARLDVAGAARPGRRGGPCRRCGAAWPAGRRARPRRRPAAGPAGALRGTAGRAAAGRAGPGAAGPGPRRTRPRCSGTPRPTAVEPGRAFKDLGLRLADRGRAAQPAERRDRAAAARHAGLRLPDPGGAGRLPARPSCSGDRPRPRRPPVAGRRRGAGEPVAIVAMGCRFPGGVRSPEELWELLAAGARRDLGVPGGPGLGPGGAVRPGSGSPGHLVRARRAGSSTTRRSSTRGSSGSARGRRWRWTRSSGCCWRCRWEALERAGIDPASLRGSPTGVFAGAASSGYGAGLRGRRGGWRATC